MTSKSISTGQAASVRYPVADTNALLTHYLDYSVPQSRDRAAVSVHEFLYSCIQFSCYSAARLHLLAADAYRLHLFPEHTRSDERYLICDPVHRRHPRPGIRRRCCQEAVKRVA